MFIKWFFLFPDDDFVVMAVVCLGQANIDDQFSMVYLALKTYSKLKFGKRVKLG